MTPEARHALANVLAMVAAVRERVIAKELPEAVLFLGQARQELGDAIARWPPDFEGDQLAFREVEREVRDVESLLMAAVRPAPKANAHEIVSMVAVAITKLRDAGIEVTDGHALERARNIATVLTLTFDVRELPTGTVR